MEKAEYGDKYSGGLGTYTAKHHPLAIYSEEANKTFFVYGGTTGPEKPFFQLNRYKEASYPIIGLMRDLHAQGKLTGPPAVLMAPNRPSSLSDLDPADYY